MCHHGKSETGNAAGAQNREGTKMGLDQIYHTRQTSMESLGWKWLANQLAEEAGRVEKQKLIK